MINIKLLVIFAVIGIGLCVIYNIFIIRKYPDNKRKGGYVLTVIVFLIVTAALFAIFSVKLYVDKAVPAKSNELVESIKKDHSDIGFVKNGLDLTGINDDISRLNNTVADLRKVLPSHTELGIGKGLYDLAADTLIKELQKKLMVVDYSGKAVNSFADENNFLTVSSVINSLQKSAMKIANITLIVIASIFVIIFLVHIIKSLTIVSKERKAASSK